MLKRRSFLRLGAAASVATSTAGRALTKTTGSQPAKIRAVAFDAFPIFDPRPILHACEEAFPGRGTELANVWRTRQFEYQWLRALGGRYEDFWQATRGALEFAVRSLQLELDGVRAEALMEGYLSMRPWPDVPEALSELRRAGYKLALLSNATPAMLVRGVQQPGLEGVFHEVISTDRIKSFKPDPRAYRLGMEVLSLRREEILFVAFAGWDVAGAKWFGYPTFWNNRQQAAAEELGAPADASGETLRDVVRYLEARSSV